MMLATDTDVDEEFRSLLDANKVGLRRRRPRWPWLIASFAFLQYTLIGAWLIFGRHYAIGDAFSRSLSAKLMVLSRDPHLGSMGFYWMPVPTVSRIPFSLITHPFGVDELAGPLTSALFAALTVVVLARICTELGLSSSWSVVVCLAYALNPVTMYLGANGMSESTFGFFLALVMLGLFRWRNAGTTTSLALLAVALAGAAMCRYETLLLLPIFAVLAWLRSPTGRKRSTMLLMVLPAIFVFFWWYVASYLIEGDGLFWLNASRATTATPPDAAWLPSPQTAGALALHSAFVVAMLAPAALAVVLGAVLAWREWRTGLGVVGVMLVIPIVVTYQLVGGSSWGVPRFYSVTPLLSLIGVVWVISVSREHRAARVAGWCGAVLVVAGALSASLFLSSHRFAYAEGEYAFFGPLLGREPASSTVPSDGPNRVFNGDIRPFYDLQADLDPLLAEGALVAMDGLQGVPALLTAEPKQFIVPEDRDFQEILSDPVGRFDFIVVISSVAPSGNSRLLQSELQRNTDGGTWQQVGDYRGIVKIWEWVLDGETPTYVQDRERVLRQQPDPSTTSVP
jgi:hypothetical protein